MTNSKFLLTTMFSSLFFFFSFFQITVTNSISLQLMSYFHLNAETLATFSSSYFLLNVILLIPAGIIIDQWEMQKVFTLTIIISALGTLLIAISPNISIAFIGKCLEGIGGAFSFIGGIKIISLRIPPEKLPLSIGILVSIGFLGGIAAQFPFLILCKYLGWRHSLLSLAFVGFFIAVIIYWWLTPLEITCSTKKSTQQPVKKAIASVLRNKYTWIGGLYTTCMNLPIIVLAALWSGALLMEAHHFSKIVASIITSLLFIGIMFGSPLYGYFSKYYSKKYLMIIGSLLSILVIGMIIWGNFSSSYSISLLFLLLGIFSSCQTLGYPIAIQNNLLENTSLASSICSILVLGVGAGMKILFGWILDLTWNGNTIAGMKVYSTLSFNFALLLLPGAFLLSIFLCFLLPPQKFRN